MKVFAAGNSEIAGGDGIDVTDIVFASHSGGG